jgi:hypothetical protein
MATETLTVTDNRIGKTYELPITAGSNVERAATDEISMLMVCAS